MHRFESVSDFLRRGFVFFSPVIRCGVVTVLLLVFAMAAAYAQTQQSSTKAAEPQPKPAIAAIFSAFDKFEVVAMPQGHGMQDLNDFILCPEFSEKVNDIEVEFGNPLYQPMLDRYIAGEDVPFTELEKVWRKMGEPASGASAFVEQFFPSCAH
jgi:hypothetical protein